MHNAFFRGCEAFEQGTQLALPDVLDQLIFNEQGLLPVITQDAASREVLMLAWMNRESLQKTLYSGRMIYWSRSRNQLWEKGATSGHTQTLHSMRFDCDGDAVLCLVTQQGAACHTGRRNCFYFEANGSDNSVTVTSSIPS